MAFDIDAFFRAPANIGFGRLESALYDIPYGEGVKFNMETKKVAENEYHHIIDFDTKGYPQHLLSVEHKQDRVIVRGRQEYPRNDDSKPTGRFVAHRGFDPSGFRNVILIGPDVTDVTAQIDDNGYLTVTIKEDRWRQKDRKIEITKYEPLTPKDETVKVETS